MTEEQIERAYERAMDALDKQYTETDMSTDEYNLQVRELDRWVKEMYKETRHVV